jgi:hypothetical protein
VDQETRNFLDGCLSQAAESIRGAAGDAARTQRVSERVAQIRLNASAALEQLEVGQITAALNFKGVRYMG